MHNLFNCNISHNPENDYFVLTHNNIPGFHIRLHQPDIHHDASTLDIDQVKLILADELKSLETVKVEQFITNYFDGYTQTCKYTIVFKDISDAITFLNNPCINLDENQNIKLSISSSDPSRPALTLDNALLYMIRDQEQNDDDIIAYIDALHLNGRFSDLCNRRNIFSMLMTASRWTIINHILKLRDTNGDIIFDPNTSLGDKQKPMLIEFMLKEAPICEFESLLDHPMINPNIMEKTILNPLKLATEFPQTYFEALLKHPNININAQDHLDNTAAHLCASNDQIDRLIALINTSTHSPFDLDLRNNQGLTAIDTLIRSKTNGDTLHPHHPLLSCFNYDHIDLFKAVLNVVFFDIIETDNIAVLYEDLLTIIFTMGTYTPNQIIMIDHLLNHDLVDLGYCDRNICGEVPFIDFVKANCQCEVIKNMAIDKHNDNMRQTQCYYDTITTGTNDISTDKIPKKIQIEILRRLILDNHGGLIVRFMYAQDIDFTTHLDGYMLLTQCFEMDKSPTKAIIREIIPNFQDDTPNMVDADGQNLLHRAIYNEKADVVKHLLSSRYVDVNQVNDEGVAPVLLALGTDYFKCIALHNKTRLNDVKLNGIPLISLCIKGIYTPDGYKDCFDTLCEQGKIDLNIKSDNGLTPLHHAIIQRDTNAFNQLLLDPRVNKNNEISDDNLYTPFDACSVVREQSTITLQPNGLFYRIIKCAIDSY